MDPVDTDPPRGTPGPPGVTPDSPDVTPDPSAAAPDPSGGGTCPVRGGDVPPGGGSGPAGRDAGVLSRDGVGRAHGGGVPSGDDPDDALGLAADAHAAAPLLNCLLREAAEPVASSGGVMVHRLRAGGRLLRVRGTRRPTHPEVRSAGAWQALDHTELVDLTAGELRALTGLSNSELPAEMLDSREAVAALLAARARTPAPEDPYRRSEQSLITGHPFHPAPKARGGGPVTGWLPYAPEVYAAFPLVLLGVRADTVVEEGDTSALDALGTAPPGYRLLPAHPWQLDLLGGELTDAFADGRLVRLGRTDAEAWPTAAIRTLYVPEAPPASGPVAPDLFLKFSLDVRITNDIRRLWRHDLLRLRRTDRAVTEAFGGAPGAWLSDRGYRTADFAFEELAVLVRDGLRGHVPPGTTPFLAAALTEDADAFPDNPLARAADPGAWWEAYLRAVVPPALAAFHDHGVVLEAHLQNTLIACDSSGTAVRALYRDAEGVKLLPDVTREAGWERLVYCLFVNNLLEIAAALVEHHPGIDPWPAVRRQLARHDDVPEAVGLLDAPTLPGKTNLLLRWTGADGADARYLPLPNPVRRTPGRAGRPSV
ncbi:IucA/IucC family protein [Streptomyces stelliscabiei]|uniref:Siderophore synthetase component n=1 Tax=Streptomyces stelliscabiei TaxID=146820 RepID=A0A8I0TVM2_9ACTN|nr:IucA/IucC family protein [Streptomyces stelliscabiei]MBE1601176.1 siderophore synthetase component [Streptomyces stelliscabiei]MDX2517053.1 IucA/IucC family protein [Streptomyces stelliscabiei]MDX2554896.1 IucA/IucC family protein [Streptomyces stelliscabiei]MDX2611123.1 IucA/IucC family protein [Streptomyces stelliscabiei]MDX2638992.1 IucA/IucC family protein [Streptomyces stelliscabiei]